MPAAPGLRALRLTVLLTWLSAAATAHAGHELPYYPSHYPQEIQIDTLDPVTAAAQLQKKTLHAYLGADPFGQVPLPADVGAVESLGSYLVLTFQSGSKRFASGEARCVVARRAWRTRVEAKVGVVFHPHPVTPYHEDYLHHLDVAQAVRQAALARPAAAQGAPGPALRIHARGKVAERLARSLGRVARGGGDAAIEEVPVDALMASGTISLNGWLGPPWLKAGWFHAYLLLAKTIPDRARMQSVEAIYQRLTGAATEGLEEHITLERKLVSALTGGCERVVLGYTVKRATFNAAFSEGVENIAYDSHAGFLSPVFLRTVKLKDFPWNGWLRLGIDTRPLSAWSPIGGFTDPAGRLIWYGVGDPGFLPAPYSASWIANRFASAVPTRSATPGGMAVPRDVLMPEPGSGVLREVGDGKSAQVKIVYRVLNSAFHDETRMTVADAIYPYSFAYRWGVKTGRGGDGYDAFVGEATAGVRRALAGLKVLRVEKDVKDFGELRITREIPVIEVYLRSAPLDASQAAAMAPPWSNLPWHVVALMEEAVKRGMAAFSAEEAKRRGVGWLDLVRDEKVRVRLIVLVEEFERQSYIPDALKGFVAPHDATLRWAALKRFAREHGHFLVTNGPYRLAKWSRDSAVLQVWRDLSYPVGVGAFDRYGPPLKAHFAKIESRDDGLRISADVERAERALRATTIVREPFTRGSGDSVDRVAVACRYVVLAADGEVVRAGSVPFADDGSVAVSLKGLKPGEYTVLTALSQNGVHIHADMRVVPFRATQ